MKSASYPGRYDLLDLAASQCRWPTASDAVGHHLFCGARAATDCPYCPRHRERAYVKSTYLQKREAA